MGIMVDSFVMGNAGFMSSTVTLQDLSLLSTPAQKVVTFFKYGRII